MAKNFEKLLDFRLNDTFGWKDTSEVWYCNIFKPKGCVRGILENDVLLTLPWFHCKAGTYCPVLRGICWTTNKTANSHSYGLWFGHTGVWCWCLYVPWHGYFGYKCPCKLNWLMSLVCDVHLHSVVYFYIYLWFRLYILLKIWGGSLYSYWFY